MAWIFILIIVLDQAAKHLIDAMLIPGMQIPIFPFFSITYVQNPGAAFGIFAGKRLAFILIGIVITMAFLVAYRWLSGKCKKYRYGTALLASGAVGNMIDRIQYGYVIDFFDLHIWPVFNIADIAIVAGAFIAMYAVIRSND
ncbi:MAG: signal peptidase II [Veillonellaceae bacterium]|nr:signal peptidase II [Veillonellaceae bacterium]